AGSVAADHPMVAKEPPRSTVPACSAGANSSATRKRKRRIELDNLSCPPHVVQLSRALGAPPSRRLARTRLASAAAGRRLASRRDAGAPHDFLQLRRPPRRRLHDLIDELRRGGAVVHLQERSRQQQLRL